MVQVHLHLSVSEEEEEDDLILPVAIYADDTIESIKRKIILVARKTTPTKTTAKTKLCIEELYMYAQQSAYSHHEIPWDVLSTYRLLSDDGAQAIPYAAIRKLCSNLGLLPGTRKSEGDNVTTYEEFYNVFGKPGLKTRPRWPLGLDWQGGAPDLLFPIDPLDNQEDAEDAKDASILLPQKYGKPAVADQKLLFEFIGSAAASLDNLEIHAFQAEPIEKTLLHEYYYPRIHSNFAEIRDRLVEQSWDHAQLSESLYDSLDVIMGEETKQPPTRAGLSSFTIYVLPEKGISGINRMVAAAAAASEMPPLEIIFKNIHASAAIPMITYVSPIQTMFRLYAPTRSELPPHDLVPALSRDSIQRHWRDIQRNRRMSGINAQWVKRKHHRIVMMIATASNSVVGGDALKELYIDFKDNGVITMYGKSDIPVARDDLSRILRESLEPVLTQMNAYLDPTGFHIPIYDDYLDSGNVHLRVENIDYFAQWQMTKDEASKMVAWPDCVECARALFLPISSSGFVRVSGVVSGRGVKDLSYVRVPGYRRSSAPEAFVARRIVDLQGTDGVKKNIIDSLIRYFPEFRGDAGMRRAVELYEEKMAENTKELDDDRLGCFCRMEMTERHVFRVSLENIASLHVLPIFERYLRSIIAISRKESLLKRICGFQNGIMAAEAEEEEEEEASRSSSSSSSSLGIIRVVNKNSESDESSSESSSESDESSSSSSESSSSESESENRNRFRIREGGTKQRGGLNRKNWKNWTWRRLEKQVPKLFENAKTYTRKCQGDLKPVILTPDEKSVIDEADADFDTSYTNSLEYEYSENGDEKFYFICPKYWSVSQNRSISERELKEKNYRILDRSSNIDDIPEEKEGEYVYKFTPDQKLEKVLEPRFIKDRESKTPLPCCYVLKEREEEEKNNATKNQETKQKAAAHETSYISEKKQPPLEKHHFGFLSPQFETFFNLDRRKFFKGNRANNDVPFVLRYGVESDPPIQSFLACFAEIYAFYKETPRTPTVAQFADIVAESVTLDVFFSLKNKNKNIKNNYSVFDSPDLTANKFLDSELYKRLDMRSEDQRRLFKETVLDYENFLDFLRDPTQSKASPHLWEIFCSERLLGSKQDINLVILESQFEGAEEHVRILCPSELDMDYNVNRDHAILYKVGKYYELLCTFVQKSKKSENRVEPVFRTLRSGTSIVPPLLAQMPEILEKIHGEMRKCAKSKDAKSKDVNKKAKYETTPAIPLSTLWELHEDKQITIVNLVLHWDGLVIGVLIKGALFVPCEPTPLPRDMTAETRHISSVKWRPFRETVDALDELSNLLNPVKPRAAIVNDEGYIVGIRVQSGQFVETVKIKTQIGETEFEGLEIVEQPNPNDVDRALNAVAGKTRRHELSPIEIEHENYSAFRSIIRKRLREYKFREVRRLILKSGAAAHPGGVEVIVVALRDLVGSSVIFIGTGTSNKSASDSSNTVLRIPRRNLVSGMDNEAFYYQRLADELVRYDRVRLYMLENTIQFTEIEYRIHDDELLVSEERLFGL